MVKHGLGLLNVHDPNYDKYDKLEVDEKTLPPVLPSTLDYSETPYFPAIDDQGAMGTCTGYAGRKQFEFYRAKRKSNKDLISARALFAAARAEFNPGDTQDDGANCT